MSSRTDRVAYNRDLYRRSPKARLYAINASRFQRGAPLLSDLAEANLRIPLTDDEQNIGIQGFGRDGAPF